ncbi:MAG: hypothetical protein Q8J78_15870 [Moraxellaceae bacterium]|nr:hypothetical protein [Moraxellaceae bacterium]
MNKKIVLGFALSLLLASCGGGGSGSSGGGPVATLPPLSWDSGSWGEVSWQ